MEFPISRNLINEKKADLRIKNIGRASIRDLVFLVNSLEASVGERFVRMEMGVPGLPSPKAGIDAEMEALKKGVTAVYPNLDGLPELKTEIARFAKLFLDIDVKPTSCVPTVGSMQGIFACFTVANNCHADREKGTLFIDPGFNINKLQARILKQKVGTFDMYNYRGKKLGEKLESMLATGEYSTILYSNPNNPTWQCFTEEELQMIGELATKYDVIVIEDLAYFSMDFRQDYSVPGEPPYQPSVAHYTENYILTISSSKAFSYAGQRIGMMVMSDKLCERDYPDLQVQFGYTRFGDAMIRSALYALSSGVSHTAQWGLQGILKAVNDGDYNYREEIKVYGEKANVVKKMFLDNGFHIVYNSDGEEPLADGFYFTVAYDGLTGSELLDKFLEYGLCAIALETTGSERTEGLRICISLIPDEQLPDLEKRLALLHNSMI
ncbi:aspartate/methionine/tyrosine aminotransferase [Balneicella halophila]|uniref:Aspartate/methionine/tyrosine aminotransferase n=1 Tax=Balneicella halophila TaxID=1537566 RepID=A0A7L4US38_BALHA|nr:pyridoxal phosphate-dependent aminotransferase [Balneicella halophila]PVX51764.1 aspartate/methionine/tyrosine aminotransferase [Balneicella halophila]